MFSNCTKEAKIEPNGNFRIRNITEQIRTTKARIKRVYEPIEKLIISLDATE